jgi:hypothetical protein
VFAPALVGFLVAIGAAGPSFARDDGPPLIDVAVERGEVTVDVRHAPLAQVLQVIAERAGIEVVLRGDGGAPITQAFSAMPLPDAIRRLAPGRSVMVAYGVPVTEGEPAPVTAVWIMAASPRRGAAASASQPVAVDSPPIPAGAMPAGTRPADLSGESAPTARVVEIQTLAGDAGLGSVAALTRLAEIGASGEEAALREQAVAALGRLNDVRAEPALVAALDDVDVSVRVRAIRGLRTFGTDTAAQSIAGALIGDAMPEVRLTALAAVGSLSGPGMLAMLQKAAADPNVTVRETALRWLAWWRARGPATP